MKVMVSIGTPNQVHFFKNIIWKLEKDDHEAMTAVRDKEIAIKLLNTYKFKYSVVGKSYRNVIMKGYDLFKRDYKLLKIAKRFKPDVLIGHGAISAAHISRLIDKPSINHEDTEQSMEQIRLYKPFVSTIITPSCFGKDLGLKQIRYNGYKELAYLHPNWFKPDPSVLDMLGVSKDEKYVVLRFSAFSASHDIGIKGFSLDDKRKIVRKLKEYTKVFISSETKLSNDLEKYAMKIPPHKMHDVLYYASLLIGDTETMTTEAGILGTPVIINHPKSLRMSNFVELEKKYGLIFNIQESETVTKKAVDLIQQPNLKQEWQKKREKLLEDKIDVTAFMTWFIEDYPESFQTMKENPEYQEGFK